LGDERPLAVSNIPQKTCRKLHTPPAYGVLLHACHPHELSCT